MRSTQRRVSRDVAGARMSVLFGLSLAEARTDMDNAKRYVRLIKKISTRYKVKLSKEMRHALCKKCDAVMIPGMSSTVNIVSSNRHVAYRCKSCGWESHLHY